MDTFFIFRQDFHRNHLINNIMYRQLAIVCAAALCATSQATTTKADIDSVRIAKAPASELMLRPIEPTYLSGVTETSPWKGNWFLSAGAGVNVFAGNPLGCGDMDEEGLDLLIDGDFISAKGTTLGGDDGIAVAYALAILDDDSLSHPRLEFVCTVCEEVGMEGATGIDVSMLKGKKLLNMDSEEEGVMLASCAGGCRADVKLPVERETVSGTKLTVSLSGLTGGHSGSEIDKGRGHLPIATNSVPLR